MDCLRATEAWVDGLSLVAVEPDGTVVGHLLLSWVDVTGHAIRGTVRYPACFEAV